MPFSRWWVLLVHRAVNYDSLVLLYYHPILSTLGSSLYSIIHHYTALPSIITTTNLSMISMNNASSVGGVAVLWLCVLHIPAGLRVGQGLLYGRQHGVLHRVGGYSWRQHRVSSTLYGVRMLCLSCAMLCCSMLCCFMSCCVMLCCVMVLRRKNITASNTTNPTKLPPLLYLSNNNTPTHQHLNPPQSTHQHITH